MAKSKNTILTKENFIKISRFLYDSVKHDIRIKAVIFFIGILLWFNITSQKVFEQDIDVDIRLTNIKNTRTLLNDIDKKAKIKIKASGKILAFSNLKENSYFNLDLREIDKRKVFKLTNLNFINKTSSEISDFDVLYPRNIEVMLDSLATKKVPVSFNKSFTLAPGYVKTGDFSIFPDSVILTGPLRKISEINVLNSVVDMQKELTVDYNITLPLLLTNEDLIKYSHEKVKGFQKIVKKGTNSYKVWINIKNKPKKFKFTIDPVYLDIEVTGPVNELMMISNRDFKISVDFKKYDSEKKTIEINAQSNIELQWSISNDFVNVIEI